MSHARRSGPRSLLIALAVLALPAAAVAQSSTKATPAAADNPSSIIHVLGLEDVKQNAKGELTVTPEGLDFRGEASHAMVRTPSIVDIFTGEDSRQTGGVGLTVAKMAVPYGGGRVLSLFTHEKFDSLTVEYRDENGGLHGALFRLPLGQAAGIKRQLIAEGAKASVPVQDAATTKDSEPKEKK